ncbi:MAG: radical SAM family heme chaperone HemW [Hyphomonadaceae bacterium]
MNPFVLGGGFGIYVHWPYCAAVCPYCDFNVRRDRGGEHRDLVEAIARDLQAQAARTPARGAQSLSFGGGTPSLLSARDLTFLIEAADKAFGLAPGAEISLEANPEHYARYGEIVRAGINRLSLGVQALSGPALMMLGRRHTAAEAVRAVEAAAATGARVSIDLIYARDGQPAKEWAGELAAALRLPIEHLSLYQLTIEAGTPFARAVARGRMAALSSELAGDLYTVTQAICAEAGFPAYEVSNHARAPEAQARHNLIYWRSGEWVGVGPGAHGRVSLEGGRTATRAHASPKAYVAAVAKRGVGWAERETLSQTAIADEMLIMGLRLNEGFPIARLEAARGRALPAAKIAELRQADLLYADDLLLRLTPKGRLLTDKIAEMLSD